MQAATASARRSQVRATAARTSVAALLGLRSRAVERARRKTPTMWVGMIGRRKDHRPRRLAPLMSGIAPTLPPQVRVFVRDWLSSNNILVKGRGGHVLIDSGYARHAPLTLALLATPQGIGAAALARLGH